MATLRVLVLLLLAACAMQARAFDNEWDWGIVGVTQSFPTKAAAVAYLHGPMASVDSRYALLTVQAPLSKAAEGSDEYPYQAPKIPPIPPTFGYFDTFWGGYPSALLPSEASWLADRLARMTSAAQCPAKTLVPTEAWHSLHWGWGGVPDEEARDYEGRSYQFLTSSVCKEIQIRVELRRRGPVLCPTGYTGETAAPGCRLPFTATITARPNYRSCSSDASPSDSGERANPCNALTGDKFETVRDYTGVDGLYFERYFHSRPSDESTRLGTGWSHNYQSRLIVTSGGVLNGIVRPNGYREGYQPTSSGSVHSISASGLYVRRVGSAWRVYYSDGTYEEYNSSGVLVSITRPNGGVTALTYAGELLTKVTGPFGHTLEFQYDSSGRLERVITPSGGTIEYSYSGSNLQAVAYPDGTSRNYHYEDTNFPSHLTGVTDENGTRFSTFAYDSVGRATLSKHAGDVDKFQLAYDATSSTVTNPLGLIETISFTTVANKPRKITQTSKAGLITAYAIPGTSSDVQRRPTQVTDARGLISKFAYTLLHLTSKTEAFGTPLERTITYTYLDDFSDLPTLITEPGRTTAFSYDSAFHVVSQTVTDTSVTPNLSRTWAYTYDANGRVLTQDGPRTDVSDITTYTYYTCTTGAECGQLHTVTNALSQTTTFNSYNAHGQPLSITDANGVVTTLAYDLRQRLVSRTVGDETSSFEYWPTGLLKKVTLPDGSYLLNTYDDAHRLIRVEDGAGNQVEYTLDNAGNRTEVRQYDPSGALVRSRTQVFNALGQLWKQVGAAGTAAVATTFTYDNDGNQSAVSAPLSRNTTQLYDELNRLRQVIDAGTGVTQFGYDAHDNLVSVVDPNSHTTTYSYDAFGGVTQLVSPDTGTTLNVYDSAGNVVSVTDARAKTGIYAYDALNRISSLTYPDQTLSFTYDSGINGAGHLTGAGDANHGLTWAYDSKGRISSRSQTVGAVTQTVGYSYAGGNLTSLVTPSGQTLTYGYSNGRMTSITLNGSTSILSDVLYDPFGPAIGWTWGNGTIAARVHDLDGNLTALDSAEAYSYNYDDASRITGIEDLSSAAGTWTYGYDSRDRLTAASTSSLTLGYSYDDNGNRLTQTGSSASTFTVATGSNRLASVSGALNRTYTYDSAGNITSYSGMTLAYSDAGRLISVTNGGGTTTYVYNALGQRVRKSNASSTTLFVYDEAGHLLGEYGPSGALIQETVWLANTPVATLRPNGSGGVDIYYVHADHLGAPRGISRPSDNVVVWRWRSDPFGVGMADEDPDADSALLTYNLRFPGQYYDLESGLSYNYARDYDPYVGRYIESDPVGLLGGINTYGYVGGNPINRIDPLGQWWLGDPLPQGIVDFSAGFGDTLSFNLTNYIRDRMGTNEVVDKCSKSYTGGQVSGIVLATAIGGAAGLEAAGARAGKAGYEFSHWIPTRFGGPRSLWNGNYVSQEFHYLTDPFRYPSGWQNYGDKLPAVLQQLGRIPWVYVAGAGGAAYGGASVATGSDCGCQQ